MLEVGNSRVLKDCVVVSNLTLEGVLSFSSFASSLILPTSLTLHPLHALLYFFSDFFMLVFVIFTFFLITYLLSVFYNFSVYSPFCFVLSCIYPLPPHSSPTHIPLSLFLTLLHFDFSQFYVLFTPILFPITHFLFFPAS